MWYIILYLNTLKNLPTKDPTAWRLVVFDLIKEEKFYGLSHWKKILSGFNL